MLEVSRVYTSRFIHKYLCGTGRLGPGPRYKKYINLCINHKFVYKSAGTEDTAYYVSQINDARDQLFLVK